jgi:hypothetical protein
VTSKGKRKKAAKFPAMPEAILSGLLILACVTAIFLNHAGTVSLTLWTILLAVMAVPNIAASLLAATDLMPVREKAPETVVEPVGVSVPVAAAAVQAVVAPSPVVMVADAQ